MEVNARNERVKRRYINWLARAQSKNDKTVESMLAAVYSYDDFTKNSNYETFSEKRAIKYKDYLATDRQGKGRLSATTIRSHLKNLQAFFRYLCDQPGYRKHIRPTEIAFLSPDCAHGQLHLSSIPKRTPSLEYVKRIIRSIAGTDEIAMRDRAMIAILCLAGMRDNAVASLPIGAVDLSRRQIVQDPRHLTRTKFNKVIVSYILRIDTELFDHFANWILYLREVRLFDDADPVFPIAEMGQREDGFAFEVKGVSRKACTSSSLVRTVLKGRSEAANLEYYIPHSFRSLTVKLAMKACRTPEEFKAISQSLGHEAVTTTLRSYGTLDNQRVEDVISTIDFENVGMEDNLDKVALEAAFREFERRKKNR